MVNMSRSMTSVAAVMAVAAAGAVGAQVMSGQAGAVTEPDLFAGLTVDGIPTDGQVLVGAASTTPVGQFEDTMGATGVHRLYFRAGQETAAVNAAAADVAAGRVPWLSFKLPYSWEQMNAGAGDAWARDLADRLDAVGGPVWVAFHHEPEGDGDPAQWVKMQQRLSPIFRAKDNISYSIVLMGWNQFYGSNASQSMEALWPGKEHVDILGFDPYNWYATTNASSGKKSYTWTELNAYYTKINAWLDATGNSDVKWAIAETGYTDAAAAVTQNQVAPNGKKVSTRGPGVEWLMRAYTDMKAQGGIALSYFDVAASVNGEPGDWTWPLTGVKVAQFRSVAAAAAAGNSGSSSPSPVPSVTVAPAPGVPTVTVAAVSSQRVSLTWPEVAGATSYTVTRDGVEVSSGAAAEVVDAGVTPGATHTYTVRAVNGSGSSPAATVTVTVPRPVSFRAQNSTTGNSVAPAAVVPGSVVDGDTLVAFVTANTTASLGSVPGWTVKQTVTDQDMRTWVLTRAAAAGDAGKSVTFPLSTISKTSVTVAAYRNVHTAGVTVAAASEDALSTTSHTAPAAAAGGDGLVVLHWADKSSSTTGWSAPSGVTRRADTVGVAAGRITSLLADRDGGGAAVAVANAASGKATMVSVSLPAAS